MKSARLQDAVFKVLRNPHNKFDEYFSKVGEIRETSEQGNFVDRYKKIIKGISKTKPGLVKKTSNLTDLDILRSIQGKMFA